MVNGETDGMAKRILSRRSRYKLLYNYLALVRFGVIIAGDLLPYPGIPAMSGAAKTQPPPIPSRKLLVVIDRDATIYSSRPIAYACYQAAFAEAIAPARPGAAKLDYRTFTRDYNPFDRLSLYKKHYPDLDEEDLKRAGDASWQYYLDHRDEDRFNPLIPGMDEFLRGLKTAGHRVVILTAADIDDRRMREWGISLDGFFSMHALRAEKKIKAAKQEAIFYLLFRYRALPEEAVTIGDSPHDHIPEILSVGTAFDLGCSASRAALRAAVRIYVSRVKDLFRLFGLGEPGIRSSRPAPRRPGARREAPPKRKRPIS